MPLQRWNPWSVKELYLLLATLTVIAALGLSTRLLPLLGNGGVVLLWMLLTGALAVPLYWKARRRRRAWLQVYLREQSPGNRWLRGGVWMLLVRVLVAAVLALTLLLALTRAQWPPLLWLALLLAPLWVKAHTLLRTHLTDHVRAPGIHYVTTQGVFWLLGACLLAGLLVLGFHLPMADWRGVDFSAALRISIQAVAVQSPWLSELLAAAVAVDTSLHWLAQNVATDVRTMAKVVVWSILIMREWLFVWPVLLLLQLGYIGVYD